MASILYYNVGDRCPCCSLRVIDSIDYQNNQFTCAHPGAARMIHDLVELTKPPVQARVGYGIVRSMVYDRVYVGHDPGFEVSTPTLDASRFPHKCPRCGTSCYIGHGVEHAISALDSTCR